MSKSAITWIVVIVVIVIVAGVGWWYFNRTNSMFSQSFGTNVKSNSTTATTQSSLKSITSFTFSGLDIGGSEVIDNTNHTVTLIVPSGTDVTNLTPIISLPNSATISPNSGVAQDFTNPVTYSVTAQDGSTQNYVVTVEVATPEDTGGS